MTKSKSAVAALTVLIALHTLVALGGFIAPYASAAQHRDQPFSAPTKVHVVDTHGKLHRPFVYAPDCATDNRKECQRYPIHFMVRSGGEQGSATDRLHLFGVEEPARIFLFGSDAYGRDLFSRMLRGGQISLLAGLLATALSLAGGLLLGGIAGFYGRWVDEPIMRVTDVFMALPWLYLLLAVRAFLPLNITAANAFFLVVAVIGIIGWARPARLIRGMVLSAKERNYVVAARGFGASGVYLLYRHILPQTLTIVLTQAMILVPQYSLSEITLSFLGLGVAEPVPTWGNMLASLQQYHVLVSYWWMFLPAVPVVFVFWAYYTLASVLQEHTAI